MTTLALVLGPSLSFWSLSGAFPTYVIQGFRSSARNPSIMISIPEDSMNRQRYLIQ
jgi:hypothetical protein